MTSYKRPPRQEAWRAGVGKRLSEFQMQGPQPAKVLDGNNRQTMLTPEVLAKLKKELAVGDFPSMAAYRAGVSPQTMFGWISKGCQPDAVEPYSTLVGELVLIEAELSARMMRIIMDSADGFGEGSPDQAKWVLTNRFRYLWAVDRETGKNGGKCISEEVERHIDMHDSGRRERARAIIASLPQDTKSAARKDGFLL
jgi:hypothetical protein